MRLLRPGLHVHADDARDAADFTAQAEMNEALRIVVLLEGSVDVSFGLQRLQLTSDGRPRPVVNAFMVSVNEPEQFTRRARRGTYARRVSVGIGREWLAQTGFEALSPPLRDFVRSHLALQRWQASERTAALAEQLVHPPPLEPVLQNLYLEARVLELVAEALATLTGSSAADHAACGLRPHEYRRMRELRDFLSRPEADPLSLDDIARRAGINANTLQRHFRMVFGTTVFDHLRDSRLHRARQALERDGVTVAHAAVIAGYRSPANFSTAYRRRFGLMPKQSRSRI